MSSHHDGFFSHSGGYSSHRQSSSPGDRQRSTELPVSLMSCQISLLDLLTRETSLALQNAANVKQEIPPPYNLAYPPLSPIDGPTAYYSTGTSDPNDYIMARQYPQGHSSGYQHGQDSIQYPPVQGVSRSCSVVSEFTQPSDRQTRGIYQPEIDAQWPQGHHNHHHSTGLNRSPSWSPPRTGHPIPQFFTVGFSRSRRLGSRLRLFQHGSASMSQIQHPINNRRRTQIAVPQRPYVPHHRQNYFDQFIPEAPITFPLRSGGEGMSLDDALAENFDYLIGRDDPMFANYTGPAISIRLEVSFAVV